MIKFILPTFNFNIEKWKWNKEYRIYVSNCGNFKDEHKNIIPVKVNKQGYILIKTPYGYKSAHRLVLLTFKPIPNAEELTVDHLNHNKRDNSIYNLEWVTEEENLDRAKKDLIVEYYIKSGKSKFKTMEEAAVFAINTYNITASKEKVVQKINNAIKNNTLYCGRKWKKIIG